MPRHVLLLATLTLAACGSDPVPFGTPGGGGAGGAAAVASSSSAAGGSPATSSGPGSGGDATSAGGAGGEAAGGAGGTPPVACTVDEDCAGDGNVCTYTWCFGGACLDSPEPFGTIVDNPVAGDCYVTACDGAGSTMPLYSVLDVEPSPSECVASSYCTPNGTVHEPKVDGTWCTEACSCPTETTSGMCQAQTSRPCGQGVCIAGACSPAPPVVCKNNNGVATVTRCDGFPSADRQIVWSAPHCQGAFDCRCDLSQWDAGYCAPGTPCSVRDAAFATVFEGTCQ